jgi:hypothetical protein
MALPELVPKGQRKTKDEQLATKANANYPNPVRRGKQKNWTLERQGWLRLISHDQLRFT